MPSVILAGTTTGTALNLTGDTSGELQIRTNNGATTAMTLTTAGDVGIGTTASIQVGKVSISYDASTSRGLVLSANLTGLTDQIGFVNPNGLVGSLATSGTSLVFTTAATERMRIDSSGNVGVNTNTPNSTLTIGAGTFVASASGTTGLYTAGSGLLTILSDGLDFNTRGGLNRFVIDTSGNVGIGTSSPNAKLSVSNGSSAAPAITVLGAGPNQGWLRFGNNADIKGGDDYTGMTFTVGASERMRIDSSGNLLVGTTTAWVSIGASVQVANGGGLGQYAAGPGNSSQTYTFGRDNVTTGNFVFAYNGAVISNINPTNGVYTAVSDSRLKKNIEPLQYGLNEILQLNPVVYNMNTQEDSDKKIIGLIAQEVKAVMDEAVDDLKDQENQMYGLDKSGLVPVLIKAIQELKAELDSVKAELQTLKGA
jgi:hypothetical protein